MVDPAAADLMRPYPWAGVGTSSGSSSTTVLRRPAPFRSSGRAPAGCGRAGGRGPPGGLRLQPSADILDHRHVVQRLQRGLVVQPVPVEPDIGDADRRLLEGVAEARLAAGGLALGADRGPAEGSQRKGGEQHHHRVARQGRGWCRNGAVGRRRRWPENERCAAPCAEHPGMGALWQLQLRIGAAGRVGEQGGLDDAEDVARGTAQR